MTYDITGIIEVLLTLILTIVSSVAVPYLKSVTDRQQQESINKWVKIAVLMAEQLIQGDGRGQERKQLVREFLERNNLSVDEDKLDAMIEAVVCTLNNGLIQIDS